MPGDAPAVSHHGSHSLERVDDGQSHTFTIKSKCSRGEAQGSMGALGRSTNNLEVKSESSLEERRLPQYPKEGFEGDSLWGSPRQEKSNVKIC